MDRSPGLGVREDPYLDPSGGVPETSGSPDPEPLRNPGSVPPGGGPQPLIQGYGPSPRLPTTPPEGGADRGCRVNGWGVLYARARVKKKTEGLDHPI